MNPPVRRLCALAFVLALVPGGRALAQAPTEADRLLRFADELLQAGESYRAITEYLRFSSYHAQDPRAAEIPVRVALAYLQGGRPEQAILSLAPLLESEDPRLRSAAVYLRTRALGEAGEHELALRSAEEGLSGPMQQMTRQRRLQALLRLGRLDAAAQLLQRTGESGLDRPVEQSLLERLTGSPRPARRSPVVAGVLSGLLPGAGQLYAGRRRDALVAFVLNGLFILGAVQAFRDDQQALGIVLSSFELGWYTGNIASAASSARRSNELALERYLASVADLPTLEAQSLAQEARVLLGVRVSF